MNQNKVNNVIQLIEQNNKEALKKIQNLNDHVGVIVTVGKKRLGKSFMLNRLIDIDPRNGFEISHIDEPCTKGIFMSTKIMEHTDKNGEKMKLILLDTEGLESKESSKEWDCKIFVLSLLLSLYFIYNTNGTYTRDDLEKLSFVAQISKKIRKNSSSEMDLNDFPQLMWVCRDYKFEIKAETDGRDALKKFMQTHFETENLNKTKDSFVNSFKNIDGFYLPLPDLVHKNGLSNKKLLLGIENYEWHDFSGEFYDEMNKLCQKIKENVQIKMFDKKKLRGKIFSEFIKNVVEHLNDEKTILVVDMVDALIKIDANRNLDEIKTKYSNRLKEIFSKLPIKSELMNSLEEKAQNECLNDLKKKIEESYFEEYEKLFKSYILNEKENSGIFFYYIRKNSSLIEKFCNDEFQKLEAEYRAKMNEKLSSGNFIENFESCENDLSGKIFGEFKQKLKENLDFPKKFLEKYLANEWQLIRQKCNNGQCLTMTQINAPEKSKCWINYFEKNYENLKQSLKNKIDSEKIQREEEILRKKKDEYEKIRMRNDYQPSQNLCSISFTNERRCDHPYTNISESNSISENKKSHDGPRCKDGTLDMRRKENRGMDNPISSSSSSIETVL
ncbi:Guanylate-binding N-terminal domain containing [Brachionus plicatilis]|uniref:Guanylate-binding N-terminal domain containing n=1 Tax=Brachionus plicatilis TaxID=10195 RepID=A0A3M7RBM4_BRAPC|nr:Guanylate-binding N-terminal domain containing [Brachionus plicatilis]